MDEISTFKQLDVEFSKLDLNLLQYVQPKNIETERVRFFSKKVDNPSFRYANVVWNLEEKKEKIRSFVVPKGLFGPVFVRKQEELIAEYDVVGNLGDRERVMDASIRLYGAPSKVLVRHAKEILAEGITPDVSLKVDASVVKRELEAALEVYGLPDWKVRYSRKQVTTTVKEKRMITLGKSRMFSEKDAIRLAVHEVGVHVLRAANGRMQPLKLFVNGFPRYLGCEEGLAAFFEDRCGFRNEALEHEYAARVIAVDSVVRGCSFRETFRLLKEFEVNDDRAWILSWRAHRAGGFIKDHVYLEGFLEVKKYAEKGTELAWLYVGKVGLDDEEIIKKALKTDSIKHPRIIPDFAR